MNIAISGFGRMGHLIKSAAETAGEEIISSIDPLSDDADYKYIDSESLKDADVVIDFSVPGSAMDNIEAIAKAGRNAVIGTTGWYDRMEEAKEIVGKYGTGLIWSGNFSTGVNLFFQIIKHASALFNNFTDYDPFIHEYHHNRKADSPSGTAVMLGNIVLSKVDRKARITSDSLKRKIEPDELHISSTRGGHIPGTHIVTFDSPVDTIELKHTARGREGFAAGAVAAARWIKGKKGFYTIDDMMKDIIKGATEK